MSGIRPKTELGQVLFALLVTAAIIAAVLGAMYVYTGNWPPMVVVESDSMQHSSSYAYFGDINTGDIVMVKRVSTPASIQTYVTGQADGYRSYGEYGNVIIYRPFGLNTTPVIHRAIIYLQYNSTGQGYNAPSLSLLPRSQWFVLSPQGRIHQIYDIKYNIEILNVGYTSTPVIIPIESIIGADRYSGFITMGDHNHALIGPNATDQSPTMRISSLVKFSWIIGIASGYLPYVGIVKMLVDGKTLGEVPLNSVLDFVAILVLIMAAALWAEFFPKHPKVK